MRRTGFEEERPVEQLYNRISDMTLSVNDRELLSLCLSHSPSQSRLDSFLEHWDIEDEGASKALLLSYLKKDNPALVFNSYTGPRLDGLLNYFRYRNLKLIAHCGRICKALVENGIEFMPVKGGAVMALRPDRPRNMSGIEMLVRESDYARAVPIVRSLGYEVENKGDSAIIRSDDPVGRAIIVHGRVPFCTAPDSKLSDGFFSRAKRAEIFGVDGLVPSPEDQLCIVLTGIARNIKNNSLSNGVVTDVFDTGVLLGENPEFNLNTVLDNCAAGFSRAEICFAAGYVNSLVPDLIPATLTGLLDEKEMSDFLVFVELKRLVLLPLQKRSHELGIRRVLTHPGLIPDFVKVRPLYTLLKLLCKKY